jgi:hypothetical protein
MDTLYRQYSYFVFAIYHLVIGTKGRKPRKETRLKLPGIDSAFLVAFSIKPAGF